MKKLNYYLLSVLIITILIPSVIVKAFNIVSYPSLLEGKEIEKAEKPSEKKEAGPIKRGDWKIDNVKVYNPDNKKTESLQLDEYIKGVVAAEMPARFHMEALKAQAVAARTYAISRSLKYKSGHKDHKEAPLCSSVHCQAYLNLKQLKEIHGEKWIKDYWGKIEEAVESTAGEIIYYGDQIIEPLYHSTSGGKTEDAIHVFATDSPYLKSVDSPFEEEAPKYREVITFTADEFIKTINKEYKDAKLDKKNFFEKIKLIEKTPTGRVKKLSINKVIVNGRDIR